MKGPGRREITESTKVLRWVLWGESGHHHKQAGCEGEWAHGPQGRQGHMQGEMSFGRGERTATQKHQKSSPTARTRNRSQTSLEFQSPLTTPY